MSLFKCPNKAWTMKHEPTKWNNMWNMWRICENEGMHKSQLPEQRVIKICRVPRRKKRQFELCLVIHYEITKQELEKHPVWQQRQIQGMKSGLLTPGVNSNNWWLMVLETLHTQSRCGICIYLENGEVCWGSRSF